MSFRLSRAFFIWVLFPVYAAGMGRSPAEEYTLDPQTPAVVAIDPGHGGKNEGADVYGRKEREIVLAVAQRLQEILEERPALSPYLTRWDDDFVALTDRVTRGEAVGGKVFVSLHVDNNRVRKGRGVITYVYGSNRTIPKGPERERDEKILPKPPRGQIAQSRRLAAHIQKSMRRHGINAVEYVDRGPFAVLKSAWMPSVIVELGNLRDKKEAAMVSDPRQQARLAEAIADSIEGYLRERYGGVAKRAGTD
ncbi:MAG: N-acetylmuramoyl-L-alanine amidase [Elusimicrobiota bacterium]